MIRLLYLKTCCHISFEILRSDFRSGCKDLRYFKYIDLKNIEKDPSTTFFPIDQERGFVD